MLFRCRNWSRLALLVLTAFVLWGCDLPVQTEANESPSLTPATESAQDTPAAIPEQQYVSQDFGFSLSYPATFEVESSFPHTVAFLAPQGTQGHRERGWLTVESAAEDNAGWYANQAKEENANLGVEITFTEQDLGGQQAYILGRVPGQDLNRQVFIVHDGMLYRLRFTPDDPAAGEAYQQMEALYAAILGSLRFLPEHEAVPPVTEISNMIHHLERALNARSSEGIARLLGDEFVLGTLTVAAPEPVAFSRHGQTDVIPLILNDQLSQSPAVAMQYQVDWASVPGSLDTYSGYFPGEVVTPILARGWGPTGAGQAVMLITRRMDGSLFWRGVLVLW